MKNRLVIAVLLLFFMPAFLSAEYNDNLRNGMNAYKQNDIAGAIRYYSAAYKEKPSKQLYNTIMFLYNKSKGKTAAAPVKKESFPWKWVLIGADAASLGLTVMTYMDYGKQADAYMADYNKYNNTTTANYNLLKDEQSKFNSKQGAYAAAAVVTLLLVGYTATDMLVLHQAFPIETAMGFDPVEGKVVVAVNYRY